MNTLEIFIGSLIEKGLSKRFISDNAEIITLCADVAHESPHVLNEKIGISLRWKKSCAVLKIYFEPCESGLRPLLKGRDYSSGESVLKRWAADPNEHDIKGAFQWLLEY